MIVRSRLITEEQRYVEELLPLFSIQFLDSMYIHLEDVELKIYRQIVCTIFYVNERHNHTIIILYFLNVITGGKRNSITIKLYSNTVLALSSWSHTSVKVILRI